MTLRYPIVVLRRFYMKATLLREHLLEEAWMVEEQAWALPNRARELGASRGRLGISRDLLLSRPSIQGTCPIQTASEVDLFIPSRKIR